MYWTAAYGAFMLLGALSVLGWLEHRVLRRRLMVFRISAAEPEAAMRASNAALKELKLEMQHFSIFRVGSEFLLEFDVDISGKEQDQLTEKFTSLGLHYEVVPHETVHE
jgi:hypothetical protein